MGLISGAIGVAKGEFGHIAAGAMLGAMAGGAYGGMSRDGSMVGGAMSGALLGGLAGGAISGARGVHGVMNMNGVERIDHALAHGLGAPGAGKMSAAMQGLSGAGVKEYRKARIGADKAWGLIGSTYSKGINKIEGMTAKTGRAMATEAKRTSNKVVQQATKGNTVSDQIVGTKWTKDYFKKQRKNPFYWARRRKGL